MRKYDVFSALLLGGVVLSGELVRK